MEIIPALFMRLCLNSLLYTSAFRHFVTVQLYTLVFSSHCAVHMQFISYLDID